MKVKDSFLSLGHFKVNIGMNIRFWEDRWLRNFTLQLQYSSLYTITRWKNVSIASVFSTILLNISFRRGLVGNNLTLWHRLVARVAHTRLNEENDKFIWDLLQNSLFSVNSMYKALITDSHVRSHMVLWKMKIPLQIRNFMWYLKHGVVLTKDNLAWRNWNGNKHCVFCLHSESIQHLFFYCHFAKFLWRVVQTTFNIVNPTSVAHVFNGWANGLWKQVKSLLLVGVATLCWVLWTSRNDMMFDNAPIKTYMLVLFRVTYWLH
jgi:hypothetical protein